ncbi:MAG TPA: peptidoglycan DD-metalloendopeptidase family protein [Lachnospiraceae bacterium]|nr:peptidoglycan DD-metalloendopeptidase family protein [Lachnospiraceae bacterium]
MKKWKQQLRLLLGIIICISLFQPGKVSASSYSNLTNDSIKEKEAAVEKAKKEKETIQAGITNVKDILKGLEHTKDNLEDYIIEVDASLMSVQEKINDLEEKITEKEQQIDTTLAALEDARLVEEAQYEAMKERIKFMYERGSNFYLELILSADSFGDFLNKTEYINSLSEYDRKMLDEYVANKELIQLCKEQLEAEQVTLEEARAAQQSEQDSLQTLLSAKEQQINQTKGDINSREAQIAALKAEEEAQNQSIKDLEALIAADKRRLAEQNGLVRTYDGGVFAFPAPKYTSVSSDFGYRTHPILGVQLFHNGVDLASPAGSPILAAYNGTVIAASYTSVMGNYIMIDHGDSLYTVYMHASALYVSEGDIVSKGSTIGAVGTTGRSTGNHLHFSVRLNGDYVSPWNYISN